MFTNNLNLHILFVYAYHNEDIVNNLPDIQEELELRDSSSRQPQIPIKKKRKLDDANGKDNISSSKDWKKARYSIIAPFMGMGEFEFSKWVISASPLERQKVLQDFKKRKKRIVCLQICKLNCCKLIIAYYHKDANLFLIYFSVSSCIR